MSKPLVIVESPTKVRTIQKYLGGDYQVAATMGHIRDLPAKEMGVDVDNDFEPKYTTITGKNKIITDLKKKAGTATDIYLAPDPDREGEAIAFHAAEVLKKKGRKFHRVLFHELTKKGILEAIQHPTELDMHRYEAQQARRVLDRIVGYQVSPLLWRKVKTGLSAGRVQSVTLRIICERERQIQSFLPEEYWSITALLEDQTHPAFEAKLSKKNGKKISIPNGETASSIVNELSQADFRLDEIIQKNTRRNPLPPFTTSKLQQDAIRKLKFSAKKTMMVAQQLYEGIDIGQETVGLITYMRTDSTRIADEAAHEAIEYIRAQPSLGADYAVAKPRFFKNTKKVQDAHEAIRPTSVFRTPESLAHQLSADQLKLYRLIWQRFVASQMMPAQIAQTTFHITAKEYLFTASGSIVTFPGFMALYQAAEDSSKDESTLLPNLTKDTVLTCRELMPKQHFTQPPPRFSEASLVKELEENGIGRPSTYAAILSTIRDKGYVDLIKGYFRPSELGFIVNDLLVSSFPDIFDVAFTARMEDELDRVEADEQSYLSIMKPFYESFKKDLDNAGDTMVSMKGVGIPTELQCPTCNAPLFIKMGRNGHFIACSNYPDCTFSSDYSRDEKGTVMLETIDPDETTDEICPTCNRPMLIKQGRYGKFLACSGYPDCKHTQSYSAPGSSVDTGVKCPMEGCEGLLIEKKSRRGKTFFACNQYPKCDYATWDRPIPQPCPACGAPFLVEKTSKKKGSYLACSVPECGHEESFKENS